MVEIPQNLFIRTNHTYPPNNHQIYEEYFYDFYVNNNIITEREYIPILWTNLYISRNYGNSNMDDVQTFLNNLDRSKKYFTVLQYDDGILQNIEDLDIIVFCSGGGGQKIVPEKNIGYPIPLVCQPRNNIDINRERDILCSFIGSNTHPLRNKMTETLRHVSGFDIVLSKISYEQFVDKMERSVFSLCPRGYGATSFRICESLQQGSIPVYIYDKDWTPWYDEFNFEDIGIKIHESQIEKIPNILESLDSEHIKILRENGNNIYNEYFDYKNCSLKIINKLNKLK
jgi:hypothetical protein